MKGLVGVGVVVAVMAWANAAEAGPARDLGSLGAQVCARKVEIEARVVPAAKAANNAMQEAQKVRDAAEAVRKAADKTNANSNAKRKMLDAAEKALADADTELEKASASELEAQERVNAVSRLCAPRAATFWTSVAGKDYPRVFYEAQVASVCTDIVLIGTNDERSGAEELCKGSAKRSAFGAVAINLVTGLGDHLQARAKQEVVAYLLDRVAKKFCAFTHGSVNFKTLFDTTCTTLFPEGKSVDTKAFEFGELKEAFFADLRAMPKKLTPVVLTWLEGKWSHAPHFIAAAGALITVVKDLAAYKSPLEILEKIGQLADKATQGVTCDFTSPRASTDQDNFKACTALLLFQLGRTTATIAEEDLIPAKVINEALIAFCKNHGVDGKKDDGKCVIDPATYDAWHQRLLAFYRAAKRFLELHETLVALAHTQLPGEREKRGAPEAIEALRELVNTFTDVLAEVSPSDKAVLEEHARFVGLVFDVYLTIVGGDPGSLRSGLIGLLDLLVEKQTLSPKTKTAITTVIALGTAKDRAEVKAVLDDVTASVGSYRNKRNADHILLSINGYVGMLGGGELRRNRRDAAGTKLAAPELELEAAPLKLSAPVGIDLTVCSWSWGHFGVFWSLLDPLALDVREKDGALSADWKTMFVPGMYARIGIPGPFVLSAGGGYSFARRADENTCGNERCFDGAWQFGLTASVDVPLFELIP